jgi:hypothetical protein
MTVNGTHDPAPTQNGVKQTVPTSTLIALLREMGPTVSIEGLTGLFKVINTYQSLHKFLNARERRVLSAFLTVSPEGAE